MESKQRRQPAEDRMNPLSRYIRLETQERFFTLLDRLLFATGLLSLAVLIRELGWGVLYDEGRLPFAGWAARIILIFFICQAFMRFIISARPLRYVWQHKVHYVMVALAAITLAGADTAVQFFRQYLTASELRIALLAWLAFSQLPLVGISLLTMARRSSQLNFRYLNAGQIFATSFALAILAGALLLRMPNATTQPGSLPWIDAFFLSTSAICVTGLATFDVPSTFTTLGQTILLVLIQIGGLGIMSLTYLIGMLSGGGGIRNRFAMQSLLDERSMGEVGRALMQIVSFTLLLEAAGAAILFASAIPGAGTPLQDRLFHAVFHSVSAFCNAGFSLHSSNMSHPSLATNVPYLGAIMLLITLGGLGFPVLRNLWNHLLARILRRTMDENCRILVHTRIVLYMSAALTLLGGFFFWVESSGPDDARFLHCLFLSVSARTAGFNTFDLAALNIYAIWGLGLLMFIGASPGGTGGGVRTTTVFILFADVWRVIRGHESQILFERKISRQLRDRAFATVVISLILLATAHGALRRLEPDIGSTQLLFECISAFATVGLSLNLTPTLGTPSKMILMALMFIGRIGLFLLLTSLIPRAPVARIDYPRGILNI